MKAIIKFTADSAVFALLLIISACVFSWEMTKALFNAVLVGPREGNA